MQERRARCQSSSLAYVVAAILMVPASTASVSAHGDEHLVERLHFNRPEAWALKYFASATLLSGLETPRTRDPWSVSFGVEIGWLPAVSESDRFVGFNGTKQEDLNKAPFFARPRITVGLPRRFSVMVAFNPPVATFGITPRLLALAVERPVYESEPWTVGVRGYGQVGTVRGAYTCPTEVLPFAPGSPGNVYGCEAESSDTASLRFAGAEVSLAHSSPRRRWSPHAAFAVNYMDVGFHVNAITFGFLDNTQYTSHGVTLSGSAGITYRLTRRVNAALDAFYTPLPVQRLGSLQNRGLFNLRALLTYELR